MPDLTINGIIVNFPFEPYSVQEEYMSKVIECLQNSKHGVLESPTGTGKTLSLLCSSLSWLLMKKAQLQARSLTEPGTSSKNDPSGAYFDKLQRNLEEAVDGMDQKSNFGWGAPRIIYASRTHSQLSQAMQELKRTTYNHVNAAVLGSRDQLCINPEVAKESNSYIKVHMCQAKVKGRTCFYYNNVEKRKDDPIFKTEIMDIEDLVKTGEKMKCCPYFLSRELKQSADITFMPYNYLLDPRTMKSQGIELQNNVVLLDEAHNVEKTCEEAASLQISNTDIAICIDEITTIMKDFAKHANDESSFNVDVSGANGLKDFTGEDLCILKAMFLELEKAIDAIEIKNPSTGETFPGGYIFEFLEKAELTHGKEQLVIDKLEKIILYLTTTNSSPFARKGIALQKFSDLLKTVFSSGNICTSRNRDALKDCYKVHVQMEEQKKSFKSDSWDFKDSSKSSSSSGKIINYWCFSPGFGMRRLLDQGVRSIILTSGTLSPLKPFISELGIPIHAQLENSHIVTAKQVCVGILSQGPDGHQLNSSFNTRNDPKYIASLGRTVYNFSCLIPHGMLIFFPSYPIMKKCREDWQNSGLWTKIAERKPIYVEPQSKEGFVNIMNEYYQKIQDPSCKGAIFMAVCRGKVSEGLDFADANGRAVLITGLPFPPLKDPRVILKQKYLEEMRTKEKDGLSGQQWYQLEASRAVNQAIGRIIRHKNDYGAIILCDCRFENPSFKEQLSSWLRPNIIKFRNFGMVTKELRQFFRYTKETLPQPKTKSSRNFEEFTIPAVPAMFDTSSRLLSTSSLNTESERKTEINEMDLKSYVQTPIGKKEARDGGKECEKLSTVLEASSKSIINFSNCSVDSGQTWEGCELTKDISEPAPKKRKLKISPLDFNIEPMQEVTNVISKEVKAEIPETTTDKKELGKTYLKEVKRSLSSDQYKSFAKMIQDYTKNGDFNELLLTLEQVFPPTENLRHLFKGFRGFLKKQHIHLFDDHVKLLSNFD